MASQAKIIGWARALRSLSNPASGFLGLFLCFQQKTFNNYLFNKMTESCPSVAMFLVLLCFGFVFVLENLWLENISDENCTLIIHAWRKLK